MGRFAFFVLISSSSCLLALFFSLSSASRRASRLPSRPVVSFLLTVSFVCPASCVSSRRLIRASCPVVSFLLVVSSSGVVVRLVWLFVASRSLTHFVRLVLCLSSGGAI